MYRLDHLQWFLRDFDPQRPHAARPLRLWLDVGYWR